MPKTDSYFEWVMYNTKIKTPAISKVETAALDMVKIINSELLYYNSVTPKINMLSNMVNSLTGVGKDIETVGNTLMNIDALKGAAAAFVTTTKNIAMSVIRVSQLGHGLFINLRFLYDEMLKFELRKNEGLANPINVIKSSNSVEILSRITSDPKYMNSARRIMLCAKEIDNMMDAMTVYSKEAIVNISTVMEIMKMTVDEFKSDKRNRIEDSLKKTIYDEFAMMTPKLREVVTNLISHDKHLAKTYNDNFRAAWKSYIEENAFDPAFNVRDMIDDTNPESILIHATKIRNALQIQVEAARRELDNLEKDDEASFNIKVAEVSDPELVKFRAYNLAIKDLQSGREKSIKFAIDGLTRCISLDEKRIGECVSKLPRLIKDPAKNQKFYIGAVKHVDALKDNNMLQKRVVEMLKAASKNPALDLKTAKNIDGFVEKQFAIEKMNSISEDLSVSSKIMREEAIDDMKTFEKKLDSEINMLKTRRNINHSFTEGVINSNDLEDVSLMASGTYGSPFAVPFKYHGGCLSCGGSRMIGGKGKISSNLFVKDDKRRFFINQDGTSEVLLYMTPEENAAFVEKKIMNKKFPKLAEIRAKLDDGLIDKKMAAKMFEAIRAETNIEKEKEIAKFYKPDVQKVVDNLFKQNREIVYLLIIKSISKVASFIKLTTVSVRNLISKTEIVTFQMLGSTPEAKGNMEKMYVTFDEIISGMEKLDFTDFIPGEEITTIKDQNNFDVPIKRSVLFDLFSKALFEQPGKFIELVGTGFGPIAKNIELLADFFIKCHYRKMGKVYSGEPDRIFRSFKGLPIYKLINELNITKMEINKEDLDLIINDFAGFSTANADANDLSVHEKSKLIYSHLKHKTGRVIKFVNNCIFVMKSIFKLMCNMDFIQLCVALKYFMLLNRGDPYAKKTLEAPTRKVFKIFSVYSKLISAIAQSQRALPKPLPPVPRT